MYFYGLTGFHPSRGIDLTDQGKFPYLHFENKTFEKTEIDYLDVPFPFKNISAADREPVYVSEPNLIAIFDPAMKGKQDIYIDHTRKIDQDYTRKIKGWFLSGYFDGMRDYPREIISILTNPDSQSRALHLEHFIKYSADHLCFEGFATPTGLYALGFIQAYLVKSVGERSNTVHLYEHVGEGISGPKIQQIETKQYNQISLDYPVDEIVDLWMILIDVWKCKPVNSIQAFHSESEVRELLGMIFKDNRGAGDKLTFHEHRMYEMPPGNYERILNLLMHATYKLNTDRNNTGLDRYCQALLDTFSCYSNTKLESLRSNISKERGNIIQSISLLQGSIHAQNVLKTLRKIKEYNVRD